MSSRILITTDMHDVFMDRAQADGFICDYEPDIPISEILKRLRDYWGLVVGTRVKVAKEMIDAGPALEWIGRPGSGMELIDVRYAAEKGITCHNSPEGNCDAVADHALGMLLASMKYIPRSAEEVKKGLWLREENRGIELEGSTVAIVGFGNTGKAFARRLRGFDVDVLVYDPYQLIEEDEYIKPASWDKLCKEADIWSFHVPLNDETYHMVDETFLDKLRKPCRIINTSRGKVIDTQWLAGNLGDDRIIQVMLDVLEDEKIETLKDADLECFIRLRSHPKVLLTPHIAGWSVQSRFKISSILYDKLSHWKSQVK